MNKNKVYCGNCEFHSSLHHCKANPILSKWGFLAPNHKELTPAYCGEKNDGNDCKDWKGNGKALGTVAPLNFKSAKQ